MRIPPYYRLPEWQRFFAGAVIGMIGSWMVFFYMYGVLQEKQVIRIEQQAQEINKLSTANEIWEKDLAKLNEEIEKKLSIQEVEITIINDRSFNLDKLSVAEAEEKLSDDLAQLLTKNVEDVYRTKSLLKKSIENKVLEINKKKYLLKVREIFFYTNMEIEVELFRL